MPKKRLPREQRIVSQEKVLDVTLAELLGELEAANWDLRRSIRVGRKGASVRLVIRCKNRRVPEAWAMALLLDNTRIACIDFHVTDYIASDGVKRVGWHQDRCSLDGKVSRVSLPTFSPETVEQFVLEGLNLLSIRLQPGGDADVSGQLPINQG